MPQCVTFNKEDILLIPQLSIEGKGLANILQSLIDQSNYHERVLNFLYSSNSSPPPSSVLPLPHSFDSLPHSSGKKNVTNHPNPTLPFPLSTEVSSGSLPQELISQLGRRISQIEALWGFLGIDSFEMAEVWRSSDREARSRYIQSTWLIKEILKIFSASHLEPRQPTLTKFSEKLENERVEIAIRDKVAKEMTMQWDKIIDKFTTHCQATIQTALEPFFESQSKWTMACDAIEKRIGELHLRVKSLSTIPLSSHVASFSSSNEVPTCVSDTTEKEHLGFINKGIGIDEPSGHPVSSELHRQFSERVENLESRIDKLSNRSFSSLLPPSPSPLPSFTSLPAVNSSEINSYDMRLTALEEMIRELSRITLEKHAPSPPPISKSSISSINRLPLSVPLAFRNEWQIFQEHVTRQLDRMEEEFKKLKIIWKEDRELRKPLSAPTLSPPQLDLIASAPSNLSPYPLPYQFSPSTETLSSSVMPLIMTGRHSASSSLKVHQAEGSPNMTFSNLVMYLNQLDQRLKELEKSRKIPPKSSSSLRPESDFLTTLSPPPPPSFPCAMRPLPSHATPERATSLSLSPQVLYSQLPSLASSPVPKETSTINRKFTRSTCSKEVLAPSHSKGKILFNHSSYKKKVVDYNEKKKRQPNPVTYLPAQHYDTFFNQMPLAFLDQTLKMASEIPTQELAVAEVTIKEGGAGEGRDTSLNFTSSEKLIEDDHSSYSALNNDLASIDLSSSHPCIVLSCTYCKGYKSRLSEHCSIPSFSDEMGSVDEKNMLSACEIFSPLSKIKSHSPTIEEMGFASHGEIV